MRQAFTAQCMMIGREGGSVNLNLSLNLLLATVPMYGCLFDSHVGMSRGGGCSLVKTDFYASMLIGETGFRSTAFTLDVKSPFSHSYVASQT